MGVCLNEKEYLNKYKQTIILENIKDFKFHFKNRNDYDNYYKKLKIQNDLKNKSLKHYYEIDNEKGKDIDITFRKYISSIKYNSYPNFLRNGKFYIILNGIMKIFNNKNIELYDIHLNSEYNILSIIELENNDLVFLTVKKIEKVKNENIRSIPFEIFLNKNYEIIIYRLKDKKYNFFQNIREDRNGYAEQEYRNGCLLFPKKYEIDFLKEISGNRFICVTNYGFKIYSLLNEKNEYSIILLIEHYQGIKKIIELNENMFIACTNAYHSYSLGGPQYNELIIEKFELKKIIQKDLYIKNKLKQIKDINYHGKENEEIIKIKTILEKLKFTCEFQEILKFVVPSWPIDPIFSDYIILKNKYFIIGVENYIIIFDNNNFSKLKEYKISYHENDKIYSSDYLNIIKWDSLEKNEFLLAHGCNIFLFKLKESLVSDINLRIINQSYFPDIKDLKIIPGQENNFYDLDKSKETIYFYEKINNLIN